MPDAARSKTPPLPGLEAVEKRAPIPTAPLGSLALPKRCVSCGNEYPADFLVCPRDATPLDNLGVVADPLVGKVLGETYQITRIVGEGGMGKVYEARHLRLKDRRFAVKVLHPEYARQPDVVARFQREAESSSSINHPNVIDVFDVHRTVDGIPYMVGEFLEGEELGDFLRRTGRLEVPVAVGVARQVCRALAAAHARGIVHRDMKPENVFITTKDGLPVIKVLDFGISKTAAPEANLTRTGMIIGTPSYMAPEQARGDKVDLRADVYAIGALLYHALTGQRPFDSEDPASTLTMVLTEEPPRPRSMEPRIPEALELVVQRAMAKDARDRYQTTAELDTALAPFDVAFGPRGGTHPSIMLPAPNSQVPQPGRSYSSPGVAGENLDVTARTMMAGMGAVPSIESGGAFPAAGTDAGKAARRARPTIVLIGAGLSLWLIGGLVDALGGVVRYFHATELTLTESVLLMLGSVFAVVTPAVLFVMRVRKVVWPNSVKAVELAADLKRTGVAAFVTYGAAAIATRVALTVVLRESPDLSSGLWDAALFGLSALGAGIAGGVGPIARSFRRKANV